MEPSGSQVAPRWLALVSASVTAGPPSSATRLSARAVKNATSLPSGDSAGCQAPSASGTGCNATASSRRTNRWLVAPSRVSSTSREPSADRSKGEE